MDLCPWSIQRAINDEVCDSKAGEPVDLIRAEAVHLGHILIVDLPHRPVAEAEQKETFPLNPDHHRTTLPSENLQPDPCLGLHHQHARGKELVMSIVSERTQLWNASPDPHLCFQSDI